MNWPGMRINESVCICNANWIARWIYGKVDWGAAKQNIKINLKCIVKKKTNNGLCSCQAA